MSTQALLYPWTISGEACPVVIGALGEGKSWVSLDPFSSPRRDASGICTATSAVDHDDEELR
ncbi:hypothetical protein ABIB25_000951 [Nakamurella sp. UYEF19]|uniref:hypothetical protein n=1 Tax=Nakamurella sp. UYEF19 TaxID=1756392 RepID=UPI003392EDE6